MKDIHTSESLKADQEGKFEGYCYQLKDGEQYMLTDGEAEWLYRFVRGRYAIADHLIENIHEDDDGNQIYTVELFGMSEALTADDCFPKAVMLSDDSALQAIFFYSAFEIEEVTA